MGHIPVLLREVVDELHIQNKHRIIDATFGGGGHAMAMLESAECFVCGIDRDDDAGKRAEVFKERYADRFQFVSGKFSDISVLLRGFEKFDAVLFDFGMSSFQVDDPKRGFSFSKDGDLDMRMSRCDKVSAYDVVNSFSEGDLADIIWSYGEEKNSRKIAYEIVKMRSVSKIKTTLQLREAVATAYRHIQQRNFKIDVATKTFQAIRIFVNDELAEIASALLQLPRVLNDFARIVTISFHSLEDRIVKNWSLDARFIDLRESSIVKPSEEEILQNPRARSAILRSFVYREAL